jgi:hypothetical protein
LAPTLGARLALRPPQGDLGQGRKVGVYDHRPERRTNSCNDSQLITPSVSAVAIRKGLAGLAVTFTRTNLDVMTLGAAGCSQPRRSQLTIGPRGLRQLAIPLLPQITELPYLVRALGGAIPRFADIVREIVETGVREIA